MFSKRNILIIVAIIVVLLILVIWKSSGRSGGIEVAVEEASLCTITETVSASGRIFPETEVKISSDVSGEIIELNVVEGDSVERGQLLLRIRPDAYQSGVDRAIATMNSARAQAANAESQIAMSQSQKKQAEASRAQFKAQVDNIKRQHDRNQVLFRENVISAAEFEASEAALLQAQANLASAEANIGSAEAAIESARQSARAAAFTIQSAEATVREAQESLQRTAIYAPMGGIVSRLNVEQGERVVGTLQMTGTEIMRIAAFHTMEVRVDVSESDVLRVKNGDEVDIEVDAYLDRIFTGKVTHVANSSSDIGSMQLTADQVTNFTVRIRIDAASYSDLLSDDLPAPFRPGMSAAVEIKTRTESDILCIPIQAVTTRAVDQNGRSEENAGRERPREVVFVARNGVAELRGVTTGIQDNQYIRILSGVEEGEKVITDPFAAVSRRLRDGSDIKIVDRDELYRMAGR